MVTTKEVFRVLSLFPQKWMLQSIQRARRIFSELEEIGSSENVEQEDLDPEEEDLDKDAIDNEDIEDDPNFMDVEWE